MNNALHPVLAQTIQLDIVRHTHRQQRRQRSITALIGRFRKGHGRYVDADGIMPTWQPGSRAHAS